MRDGEGGGDDIAIERERIYEAKGQLERAMSSTYIFAAWDEHCVIILFHRWCVYLSMYFLPL